MEFFYKSYAGVDIREKSQSGNYFQVWQHVKTKLCLWSVPLIPVIGNCIGMGPMLIPVSISVWYQYGYQYRYQYGISMDPSIDIGMVSVWIPVSILVWYQYGYQYQYRYESLFVIAGIGMSSCIGIDIDNDTDTRYIIYEDTWNPYWYRYHTDTATSISIGISLSLLPCLEVA